MEGRRCNIDCQTECTEILSDSLAFFDFSIITACDGVQLQLPSMGGNIDCQTECTEILSDSLAFFDFSIITACDGVQLQLPSMEDNMVCSFLFVGEKWWASTSQSGGVVYCHRRFQLCQKGGFFCSRVFVLVGVFHQLRNPPSWLI